MHNIIKPGIFTRDISEICDPKQINLENIRPGSLGLIESEEVFVRLLVQFSVESDKWVGVTFERFSSKVQAVQAYKRYKLLSLWTLGIYRCFVKAPAKVSLTGISLTDKNFLRDGYKELRDAKLIIVVNENIIFPTPKLIRLLKEGQSVTN